MIKLADNVIRNIKEFYNFIRSNETVKLLFKKKDGSNRFMNATLDFNKIPASKKPSKINEKKIVENLKKGIVHVYDVDEEGWRSVNFQTTYWIENDKEPNVRYRIKK